MLGLGNLFAQPGPMSVSSTNVPSPSVIPSNSLLPSHTPHPSSHISLFASSITDPSAHWSRPSHFTWHSCVTISTLNLSPHISQGYATCSNLTSQMYAHFVLTL